MSQPLRILQVVGKMHRAGAETLLMNLYRNIDREKVQFDFLTHREESGDYDEEIASMGGVVYHLCPMSLKNSSQYWKRLQKFFQDHSTYQIVHSHIDAMSALPLWGAKQAGVHIRIAHSHNTAFPKDTKQPIRLVAKKLLPLVTTHYFACSEESAKFLFPKKIVEQKQFVVLRNGIELEQFSYCSEIRERKKKELGIDKETVVIGHVGRFCVQKNHKRLLKIFWAIQKRMPNSLLLLVGEGELFEEVRTFSQKLGMGNTVRFLGVRDDIDQLMQVFDLLLLPSLYEGFPIVGVEAQAAGLPCLFSDSIKKDVALTESVTFFPLEAEDAVWANKALTLCKAERKDRTRELAIQGFSIEEQAKKLEAFYLKA